MRPLIKMGEKFELSAGLGTDGIICPIGSQGEAKPDCEEKTELKIKAASISDDKILTKNFLRFCLNGIIIIFLFRLFPRRDLPV